MTSARFSLLTSVCLLSGLAVFATRAKAQDAAVPVPEVENSRFQFAGVINSPGVLVRSGAGDNYYPTSRLDKGAQVTVVGIRFDWLKITPPDGSFSYVAKAYIERSGDGSTGRVSKPDLNIRAGSELNQLKTSVQTKLNEGDQVQIVGEADEYFKIKPPAGSYLYVSKQYVDPVQKLGPNPQFAAAAGQNASSALDATAAAPSTQPAAQISAAQAEFGKLESRFAQVSTQALEQQSLTELLASYQTTIKDSSLPESLKRVADFRITTLKNRQKAQADLADARKAQQELSKRQMALTAERQELEARLKAQEKDVYAALGTLRTSSLQNGSSVLFRITDPANGRTLVYIRSDDLSLAQKIGQLVAVRGQAITDPALGLNVITPTAVDTIDEARAATLTARITPPSFLAAAASVVPDK